MIQAAPLPDPYEAIDPELVISSGHGFVSTSATEHPPALAALDKRIARTLAAIRDEPMVAVEPHVWKTRRRDLLVRLDGFGPNVPMDADVATAMTIDALDRPRLTGETRRVVMDGLHAATSSGPMDRRHVSCSAATPWRPALLEVDDSELPSLSWWTGRSRSDDVRHWARVEKTLLGPTVASLLPRVVLAEDGIVTLDDRFGLRLRPIAWSGRPHLAMDPMQALRTLADLTSTLALLDPDARA